MKLKRDEKFLLAVFICAALLTIFGIWYDAVNAHDGDQVLVCRLSDGRIIFHMPDSWGTNWWALGASYTWYTTDGIIVAPLTDWLDGSYGSDQPKWVQAVRNGQALVGNQDYSVIVTADASTTLCDNEGYPVVEPTATPQPIPTDDCPAWSTLSATGEKKCLWDLPRASNG